MESCRGKVVAITGASSGLGAELARSFARRGAKVALLARRTEKTEALAREILARKGEAISVYCDVRDPGSIEGALAQIRREWGWLDILVANAGFGVVGDFESLTLEDYQRQLDTNVLGVVRTLQAGLSDLKRMQGRFVIIGSIKGYFSIAGGSAYSMSKFAVRALALSLRPELARHGISVTHIAPGYIETEFRNVDNRGQWHAEASQENVPAIFRMKASEAAEQIVDATMKRRVERVITWHGKVIVWLFRHFPGILLRLLARTGTRSRAQPGLSKP